MTTKCYIILEEYTTLASTLIMDFFRKYRQPCICHINEYDDYAEITIKCPDRYVRDVENLLQWFV